MRDGNRLAANGKRRIRFRAKQGDHGSRFSCADPKDPGIRSEEVVIEVKCKLCAHLSKEEM